MGEPTREQLDAEAVDRSLSAAWDKVELAERLRVEAIHRAIRAENRVYLAALALRHNPPDVDAALYHLKGGGESV
jgi:hypothetical protein